MAGRGLVRDVGHVHRDGVDDVGVLRGAVALLLALSTSLPFAGWALAAPNKQDVQDAKAKLRDGVSRRDAEACKAARDLFLRALLEAKTTLPGRHWPSGIDVPVTSSWNSLRRGFLDHGLRLRRSPCRRPTSINSINSINNISCRTDVRSEGSC